MARAKAEPTVNLSAEIAQKFKEFQDLDSVVKAGGRAERAAKKIKTEIVEAMGEHNVGELPDGRRLLKVTKSGHRDAAEAYDYKWHELSIAD
jgi:hypothetical protein